MKADWNMVYNICHTIRIPFAALCISFELCGCSQPMVPRTLGQTLDSGRLQMSSLSFAVPFLLEFELHTLSFDLLNALGT